MAPRAIAALRDRSSGARARAVSDQLRKVAYGAPSDCCPAGSQLGCQGKSGATSCARSPIGPSSNCCPNGIAAWEPGQERCDQLRKVAEWRPERLLPCGIAAREPGQERCDQLRKVAKMAPRAIAALTGSRLGSQGKSGANSCARSRMAPRAIAALRERGSGARARAVSDQLRKVAYGAPSNCCPTGTRLGSQGKSGERPAAQGRPKIEKSFID